TGDQRYVAAEDINTPTLKSMLKASSVKAVKMLSTEPVVFAFGFWIAFCWGVVFLFLSVIPITFSEKRGWSEGVSGLPYISLCIGTTLGWLANYLQMGKYEKIVQNPDRKVVPEDRLYGAMLGAPLLPIGLFIYSFTQYAFLIWVGPVIALAPIAFGIYFVFESTYSYTADCYDKQQMDPQSSVPPGGLARPRDRRRSGFFSDPRNRIEFAYDDEALIQRLYRSAWLNGKTYGKDYEFPAWLNETPDVIGDPSRISEFRLDVLRDDDKAAANYNEARYVRNRAFIRHIYEAVKTQNQHVGEHNTTSAQPLGATNVTTSQVTTHNAEGTNENDDEVLYLGSRQVPNGNDDDVAFFGSREVAETAATPASISSRSTSSSSMDISEVEAEVLIGSGEGTNDNDDDVAFVGSREGGETAATPVSISSSSTSSSSTDLTQSEAETESTLEIDQAHMPSQTVAQTGGITQRPSGRLERLADVVSQGLSQVIPNDCIQECGQAPLKIIAKRFDEVLTIATERLNTRPFSSVQKCWRRLYEDACLFKAVHLLRVRVASFGGDLSPNQRLELQNAPQDGVWLSEIIAVLDKSLQVSGAPGRRQLHNTIFQQLSEMLPAGEMNKYPPAFRIYEPWPLQTRDGVSKADSTLDLAEFQEWLEFITQPLVIPKVTRHWPASKRWKSPRYLMEHTLGGRRLVPIELGKLYSDKDWSQKMMPFAEFTKKYLLSSRPHEVGYLAQTDLFDLIPALRADIMTPDYCWSTPPVITDEATQKTAGLSSAPYLSEPSVNVWLGPSGTRTPLHTDPYHNILCQVVGFKYVRLYAPHEALKLYPMGVTKEGINMENTSQVDISENVACLLGRNGDANVRREIDRKFPKFKEAQYQEVILNPGDCLYVPLGWWHYVESLTTSSSVNFWWS
ncbi:Clavaminate synthase-like protein, partial [Hortaea werneckii]